MKASTNTPLRRTARAILNPDEWVPAAAWLQSHPEDRSQPGLFIDDDALPGIRQLLRKARLTNQQSNMTLRLRNPDMQALLEQLRFWEAAMDELAPRFRENAPRSGHFACLAESVQAALDENFQKKGPTGAPVCARCRQPMGAAGQAQVGIDRQANTFALYEHLPGDPECGHPGIQ